MTTPKIGRPRLPDADRRRSYGIMLSGALITALRTEAVRSGESQGDIVEAALAAEFRRRRRKGAAPQA